jgi:hypothetical protein
MTKDRSIAKTVTVGAVFRPQLDPARLARTARAADAAGLDELWLWEDCFLAGGISAAAIVLANSERLRVGVGVLPVPMRNVAATAMEIATLDRAYPRRIRIGLGHGVQDWMAQIGERVTYDGRYVTLTDVGLREGLRNVDIGRVETGAGQPHSTVVFLICATGPNAEQQARDEVAFWGLESDEDGPSGGQQRKSLPGRNDGYTRAPTQSCFSRTRMPTSKITSV